MSDEYYIFLSINKFNKEGKEVNLQKKGKFAVGADGIKKVLTGFYNEFMKMVREDIEGFKPETLTDIKNDEYYK